MKQTVSLTSCVRIPDGILSHLLQSELILLHLDTGVYSGLDPVGTRVWQLMQAQPACVLHDIVETLIAEYDVGRDRCTRDVLALAGHLEENKLIDIST